jgi:hypothetical protein
LTAAFGRLFAEQRMSDNEGAAAPATEQAQPAPAEAQQATPTEGQPVAEQAAAENAETAQEERPKRRSTTDRYRRKLSAQAGVIERLASELDQLKAGGSQKQTSDLPKPSDYPQGEFDPAYVADLAAIKVDQRLNARFEERDKLTKQERAQEDSRKAIAEFEKRAAKVKDVVPDFEDALEAFVEDGGSFADHVARRLHKAGDKGPVLAYHLAKNPELADELNNMDPADAAAELVRIEAKLALPQPKKQTQAPAPLAPVKGAAVPPKDVHAAAKSDDLSAYYKMRDEQERAQRR